MSYMPGGFVADDSSPESLPNEPGRPSQGLPAGALQVALLLLLVLGLVAFLGARAVRDHGESIAHIRHDPARYDGASVTVRGRVGEVFAMGGSWAYYLHQGRDTIVVFTRSSAPSTKGTISVHGSVSVGYLDGQPRPALFESSR